jgi:hypothetical protein
MQTFKEENNMLTLYFVFVAIWAFCAGMTVFTTVKGMDTDIAWLISMWIAWVAIIVTNCLL